MISSTQDAASGVYAQLQRQLAERNAQRAEQRAQALQAETRSARADAERAQDRVRTLEVESSQAQQEAGRARRGLSAAESLRGVSEGLDALRGQIAEAFPVETSGADAAPPAQPVVNARGEVTGTVINVTA